MTPLAAAVLAAVVVVVVVVTLVLPGAVVVAGLEAAVAGLEAAEAGRAVEGAVAGLGKEEKVEDCYQACIHVRVGLAEIYGPFTWLTDRNSDAPTSESVGQN